MYERLKKLRKAKRITQYELSKMLNMTQTGYSQYESGSNDVPTQVLIKLATLYNTNIDYILDLTDEANPYPPKKIRK